MSNTEENSANAFEDVNVGTAEDVGTAEAAANVGTAEATENVGTAEATANVGTAEAAENVGTAEAEAEAAAPIPVPVPVPATTSKTGKALSVAQAGLQEKRAKTLEDMRAAYKEAFGDDKKAPKAKAYHAAGLTTIRERDGENAFQAKLQEHIAENRSKYEGKPTRKTAAPKTASLKATATAKKTATKPKNSAKLLNSADRTANGKAASRIIDSIEGMGATARELIQTMVTTTKALAKELSKSNSANSLSAIAASAVSRNSGTMKNSAATTGRKTRSNKGGHHKKHKKGAVLPPIPE